MKDMNQFRGKRVLVLGLAKSGFAASQLLHRLGATIIVNDAKPLEENEQAKQLEQIGIDVVCGAHPVSLLDEPVDFIVKNPGVPYSNPIVKAAIERGISVVTEIELASLLSEADMIAITGSNGKTTTTTLIVDMLKGSGREPLVAGNIGTVACEVAETATINNIIVTEVSSFQLMGTERFHPKVSVFLNLFDAHLDYHGTREEYGKAKAKIFANLTEDDFAVINAEDRDVVSLASQTKARLIPFSVTKEVSDGAYIKDEVVYFQGEEIISVADIVLPGKHNLENVLAAVAASLLMGATRKQITEVLKTFSGVKHRLQYVGTKNGRKFFNDSKATNSLATQKALTAFDAPIVLLAGGLDRGNGFDDLLPYLKKVKAVITFGETKSKLVKTAQVAGVQWIRETKNAETAVQEAYNLSERGDVILLSPACASWDQYRTFEERGDKFIAAIGKLME
ncbi:UDP-N-acetylmuramoyl-L-alanine--D-glutamate ligase [Desertibacillus haloalkaliphilus]|uniref:UDP-N-acetylmuramoyl-L-alanine--D-glutamate ligase n=1 Tax=Desertibacillus haloalkaliphilus TaxID=1328930 RepID=UPI001C258469|nr:UDP-N-acetylmuramoyl-L-alanine--D-glutamate ligase [Desertibacillus haloalkaliphilus]MBU8907112.1 UDP-N-acetylmuramoyl-L-alanine--D-glutamate ligase [Desertibacillus haloalkaliphilus]